MTPLSIKIEEEEGGRKTRVKGGGETGERGDEERGRTLQRGWGEGKDSGGKGKKGDRERGEGGACKEE